MNQLIESITGTDAGGYTANVLLMTMASLILISVGQIFLARRNDLGWWFVMLGFFAGPVAIALYPGSNDYWLLAGALPQFVCAAVGLYGFSRSRLSGRFTRRVHNQRFSVMALVGLLVLGAVMALLQFGQALTRPSVIFGPGTLTPWLNFGFTALIAAALVGIGFGARWAWFLSAAGGLGQTILTAAQPAISGADKPLFALLFCYVLIVLTALYAFLAWGGPLPEANPTEAEVEEMPDDAASATAATPAEAGGDDPAASDDAEETSADLGVTERPAGGSDPR